MTKKRSFWTIIIPILILALCGISARPLFLRVFKGIGKGNESIIIINGTDQNICELYVVHAPRLLEPKGINYLRRMEVLRPGEKVEISRLLSGSYQAEVLDCVGLSPPFSTFFEVQEGVQNEFTLFYVTPVDVFLKNELAEPLCSIHMTHPEPWFPEGRVIIDPEENEILKVNESVRVLSLSGGVRTVTVKGCEGSSLETTFEFDSGHTQTWIMAP